MISKTALQHQGSSLLRKTAYNLYIAPHPLLRPYISNYTISFPKPGMITGALKIIPDASGCFVFTFDGNQIQGTLWGATSKANVIKSHANDYNLMVFIEFHPYGMYEFTGIHQSELSDQIFDLDTVDREITGTIRRAIDESDNVKDLADCLDRFFVARMSTGRPAAAISGCLEAINRSKGQVRVSDLSRQESYSERHLNRLFQQQIGLSPKLLLRLVRLNQAVRLIQKPHTTLLQTALQSGYYDESHLINEFKDICKVPLNYYLTNLSDFYNETLKL